MTSEERKVIEQAIEALVRVEHVEGLYYFNKEFLAELRSLLEKPPIPFEPEGWQIVPKEPTKEMIKADIGFYDVDICNMQAGCVWSYKAMLAAAPRLKEVE